MLNLTSGNLLAFFKFNPPEKISESKKYRLNIAYKKQLENLKVNIHVNKHNVHLPVIKTLKLFVK